MRGPDLEWEDPTTRPIHGQQDRRSSPVTTGTSSTAAALLTAVIVLLVHAGGLVSVPLARVDLFWPTQVAILLVALALGASARAWRHRPVVAFVLFWVVVWLWMPYALRVAPDAGWAHREMESLAWSALSSLGALCVGVRGGPTGWRAGWLLGLALTGSIGVWELTTGNHLWVTPERPWPFRGTVAAATYINPNNFGIVLLSMLVATLAWRASVRHRGGRLLLAFAAVFASAMALASQSRAAALGLAVILGLEALRWYHTLHVDVRGLLSRHRRVALSATVAGLILVAASFLVPGLAARNPVAAMLYAAAQPETGASDAFRIRLIRLALGYAADSGFLGTGAGSFEPIMWKDAHSGIDIEANLHNAFVELLMQYGAVVAVMLGMVMIVVLAAWWRSGPGSDARPPFDVLRTELLGHLVVFTALGCTASSSLALPVWWLMLAQVCATASVLPPRRHVRPVHAVSAARTR